MEQRNSREVVAPRASQQVTGTRRTAMRVMRRKSQGIVAVYEQDPVASNAGTRTLVFETPTACTRVEKFPENWQLLSDDELSALRRA